MTRLERLSYSLAAEMTADKSGLQPEQVKESNDDAFGINSLPEEMILKIFGYFNWKHLGLVISRVCSRWNVLSRSPVLWKRIDVSLSSSHESQNAAAKSFINRLPSSVTFIELNLFKYRDSNETLVFEELCMRLREKCPRLQVLFLRHAILSESLLLVVNSCAQLLPNLKSLRFFLSVFPDCPERVRSCDTSKIENLCLCLCKFGPSNKTSFLKMPNLKKICLVSSNVNDIWFHDDASFLNPLHVLDLRFTVITSRIFQDIQNHGFNLRVLYLCFTDLKDYDLNLNIVLPHLKLICLKNSWVTCEGVLSLVQSCPSLQNVFVDKSIAESYAAHPFVATGRCKSGIVKESSSHSHEVDYTVINWYIINMY